MTINRIVVFIARFIRYYAVAVHINCANTCYNLVLIEENHFSYSQNEIKYSIRFSYLNKSIRWRAMYLFAFAFAFVFLIQVFWHWKWKRKQKARAHTHTQFGFALTSLITPFGMRRAGCNWCNYTNFEIFIIPWHNDCLKFWCANAHLTLCSNNWSNPENPWPIMPMQ